MPAAAACVPVVVIDTQPAGKSACEGDTAVFTIAAGSASGGLTHQWQVSVDDGATYNNVSTGAGGTTNTYTTAVLAPGDNGKKYHCIVDDSTACPVTSSAAALTVNPLPSANPIVTAFASTICSGNSASIVVIAPQLGVNYQLRNAIGNANVGSPVVGAGSSISLPAGILTTTTNFNVLATVIATNCSQQLTNTKSIAVNPAPDTGLAVSTGSADICAGSDANVSVAGSVVGVSYQLRNAAGNVNVGTSVAGTGGAINLPTGTLAATTTFNVLATVVATGCSQQLTATRTITVNAPPDVTLIVGVPGASICSGGSTNITVAASAVGVNYQLRDALGNSNVGAPVSGTGATINLPTGTLQATKTFNVLATVIGASCSRQLTATQTINVNPMPDAAALVGAVNSTICSGTSANVTIETTVVGVDYQLRNHPANTNVGSPVAGTGGPINLPTGPLTAESTFNILTTTLATTCSQQLTATQTIALQPALVLSKNPGDKTACAGSTAEFAADADGAGLTYQWQASTNNGATYADVADGMGSTAKSYTTPTLSAVENGNRYRCAVTGICGTVFSTAATLTIPVGVVFGSNPAPVTALAGDKASFAVTATGGGALTYRWQKRTVGGSTFEDVATGTGMTSASFTTATLTQADNGNQYRCVVSDSCRSINSTAGVLTIQQPTTDPLCQFCGVGCVSGFAGMFAGLMFMKRVSPGISRRRNSRSR